MWSIVFFVPIVATLPTGSIFAMPESSTARVVTGCFHTDYCCWMILYPTLSDHAPVQSTDAKLIPPGQIYFRCEDTRPPNALRGVRRRGPYYMECDASSVPTLVTEETKRAYIDKEEIQETEHVKGFCKEDEPLRVQQPAPVRIRRGSVKCVNLPTPSLIRIQSVKDSKRQLQAWLSRSVSSTRSRRT